MSNILHKLQYMEFPACTREALTYLVRNLSSDPHRGIPGLGGAGENIANQVAQEFIIDISRRKGHKARKLTAVHELQLLEMVSSTLQDAPENSCYNVFSAIFGGHVDPAKTNLMTKLVSIAISTCSSAVLGCAALWMQEQGSQSQAVCDLAQRLTDDYCLLYPGVSPAFSKLPKVSSLFTCNLVTALTTIYTYTDASKSPPRSLLECIVDWISDDACLCSDSVRLVRIRSNFTCPIGGLVRWCILGPLTTCSKTSDTKTTPSGNKTDNASSATASGATASSTTIEESDKKLLTLFSRLHLGVLLSLQAYKSMELKEQLLSYGDMFIVSKTLAANYQDGRCTEQMLQEINTASDRLGQIIQVAIATGSLSDKLDMRQICEGLPANRLLHMVASRQHGRQAEAMDLS